jgi:hypothetical protein
MPFDPFSPDFAGQVTNIDDLNTNPEQDLALPWVSDPAASWLDYRCWVEVSLDSGMALHKPLPRQDYDPDTLAQVYINDNNLDTTQAPYPVGSSVATVDVIQRMATSDFRFVLRGWAMRAGYPVPIPGLKYVGGITPVPDRIQRAANLLIGNWSGVPIFYAYWELHYMLPRAPTRMDLNDIVPFNPALHVRGDAKLPDAIGLPVAPTDQNSALAAYNAQIGGISGIGILPPNNAQLRQ